jgi:hypothetical protein
MTYSASIGALAAQADADIAALQAQVASLQAQLTSTQPGGAGTTPVQTAAGTLPTGDINNLSGSTGVITIPPATWNMSSGFGHPSNFPRYTAYLQSGVTKVLGSGIDVSYIQTTPNSMTTAQANLIPPQSTSSTGGTNPLWMLRMDNGGPNALTLQGTNQNGKNYNGFQAYYQSGKTIGPFKVTGIPGDNAANPGETFSISDFHGTGNTWTGIEVDGRNLQGTSVAATAFGVNFATGYTITGCHFHHMKYGHGVATYQSTGSLNFTNVVHDNGPSPFNFERCGATSTTITMTGCTYYTNASTNPVHMIIDSDLGNCTVNIHDPVYTAIGGKFVVCIHSTYGGVSNHQLSSSIHIFSGATDVTASTLQVVTHGPFG